MEWKTEPYRSALTCVPEPASPCPGKKRSPLHRALVGNSKKTPSRQARLLCFSLDVKKQSFTPSFPVWERGWGSCSVRYFSHSLGFDALVSNPATEHKRSGDARKAAPKIWGQVVRSRALGWREITPLLFWRALSWGQLNSPDRSLGETNFLVCLFEPDCFSPLSSRSRSCYTVTQLCAEQSYSYLISPGFCKDPSLVFIWLACSGLSPTGPE